jgi:hypothetical protein
MVLGSAMECSWSWVLDGWADMTADTLRSNSLYRVIPGADNTKATDSVHEPPTAMSAWVRRCSREHLCPNCACCSLRAFMPQVLTLLRSQLMSDDSAVVGSPWVAHAVTQQQ